MRRFIVLLLIIMSITVFMLSLNINATSDYQTNNEEESEDLTQDDSMETSVRGIPGGGETNGETWYGIELNDDGKPIITYEIEYGDSNLLKYLKPGDIVYERNNAFFIADWVKHIAIVIDVFQGDENNPAYVLMIEAMPSYNGNDYGVVYSLMTPTRFIEKQVSIMRVKNATDEQIQGAIEFAKLQVEQDDIWFLKPWKETDWENNVWYCSELVWAAYYHQGIFLEPHDNSAVLPEEIYESDAVSTIMQYNLITNFSEKTDSYHTYSCDGDTYTEEHDYEDYGTCHEKCRACEYVRFKGAHSYTSEYRQMNSATHHYAYCDCGERTTVEHAFYTLLQERICLCCNYRIYINHTHSYSYTPFSFNTHKKTCSCGDTVRESCIGAASIDGTSRCTKCGQTLPSFPELLSVDEEEDAMIYKDDEDYTCCE